MRFSPKGENEQSKAKLIATISGGYCEKVTPVPIPNTVVKLLRAENTWRATARKHKSPPELTFGSIEYTPERFFSKIIYSSIAQLVEHAAVNRRVVGSSPTGGANGSVVKRSRHRPFTAVTGVRFPSESPRCISNSHILAVAYSIFTCNLNEMDL